MTTRIHNFPISLLALLCLMPCALLGQIGKEYRLTSDAILRECDIKGTPVANGEKLAPYGANFTVVGQVDQDYILVFYDWYTAEELSAGTTKMVMRSTLPGQHAQIDTTTTCPALERRTATSSSHQASWPIKRRS